MYGVGATTNGPHGEPPLMMPERMSDRTRVIGLVLVAITIGIAVRAGYVERSDFNASDLAHFETVSGITLPDHFAMTPFWLVWSRGDGQTYIALGVDPLAQDETRRLGAALYRFGRVGYSLAALVLVAGQQAWLPYGLFGVSLLSLATLGWIAARQMPVWGPRSLILLIVPGALIATASDTAEAFGLALAALAVLASRHWSTAAAGWLGIVRPDFGLLLLLRGRSGVPRLALCLATAAGVRLAGIGLGLDYSGLIGTLTLPLAGYIEVLTSPATPEHLIVASVMFAAAMTLVRGVTVERSWSRAAYIGTGLFLLMLAPIVLDGGEHALRVAASLSLLWAIPPRHESAVLASVPSDQTRRLLGRLSRHGVRSRSTS